jgi:hypothetical protein
MSNAASVAISGHVVRLCLSRWTDLSRLAAGLQLLPCSVGRFYGGASHPRLVDAAWFHPATGLKYFARCRDVPVDFLVMGILNLRRYECVFVASRIEDRKFWFLSESASFQRITPRNLNRVVGRQLRAAMRRWVAGFNLVGVNGLTGCWYDPQSGELQSDPELAPCPLR